MATGDLATLTDVKAWLSLTNSGQDAVLSRLITSMSGIIRTHINRFALDHRTYTDRFNGTGTQSAVLRNWPITKIRQVVVGGTIIPASTPLSDTSLGDVTSSDGWVLQPAYDGNPPGQDQTVVLLGGYYYQHGNANVAVTYDAGYWIPDEAFLVPTDPFQYQVAAPQGPWCTDNGVVYAETGTPLVRVASAPSVGQYALAPTPPGGQPGLYQFSGADVGVAMLVSYSFAPYDLSQAVIEWIGERNAYRARIGLKSKSLGGQESMSWDLSGIPAFIAGALQPYVDVVPHAL